MYVCMYVYIYIYNGISETKLKTSYLNYKGSFKHRQLQNNKSTHSYQK